jgi:DNA polymerase-3 subunit beta
MKGLRKVSTIISKSEPVRVMLRENEIGLEAESDIGKARENIEVEYQGEELTLNFNVRFVVDVLAHIDQKEIFVKAPSGYGAVLFEGDESDTYKNIIMPIRV